MADAVTIADLRRLINEPDNVAPWTDATLSARLDAAALAGDSINTLAATIWREKAATYAELVDIKEGSSDRKLSQMYKQALEMANGLGGSVEVEATGGRYSRTRRIERA